MRILFIGDIVGKSGRDIVSSLLYSLKRDNDIDLVIANGENSAHGKGITYKIYRHFLDEGIDYITMGNHTYSKSEIISSMPLMDRLIVPYNHSQRQSSNFYRIIEKGKLRFCLCNILGETLIPEANMSPFQAFSEVLKQSENEKPDFYFVDLHAETTAEKRAFLEYFYDKAKVIVGTHTHVQTADEDIIHDCAFISDVGMCGPYDSIIGRDPQESIATLIYKEKTRYTVGSGPGIFCAVIIDIDEEKKIPAAISRIRIRE